MDCRNDSPVVDLSVKKHLPRSPVSNSYGPPLHINLPGHEVPQDLSSRGIPYFMPSFDPLRLPNFGFPAHLAGLNMMKNCDKPMHLVMNGDRTIKKPERRSSIPESERKCVTSDFDRKLSDSDLDQKSVPEPDRKPIISELEYKSGVPVHDPDSPERRRSLRPRSEVKYNVSPIPLLPDEVYALNGGYTNGVASDSDDDDSKPLPLLPLPKELSPEEYRLRERRVRRLKAELRQEEVLLYLLHMLKKSQSVPPSTTETVKDVPVSKDCKAPFAVPSSQSYQQSGSSMGVSGTTRIGSVEISPVPMKNSTFLGKPGLPMPSPLTTNLSKIAVRSSTPPSRAPSIPSPLASYGYKEDLPHGLSITAKGPSAVSSGSRSARVTPPVTPSEEKLNKFSTPALQQSPVPKAEDPQSIAQRQAAAKLALRKQLEKTLLQIPPPKPPPPEMHFIPNPNNTEFVYLLGLETVVDSLLPGNRKQDKPPPPPAPFICSQCKTDFSPVWKWEKKATSLDSRESVMCEQCVSSTVKRALRAEHTARLKSAFMRALQQEQELEQHSSRTEKPPAPSPAPPPPVKEHHLPPPSRPSPLASPSHSVATVNRERERMREREMREKAREERHKEKMKTIQSRQHFSCGDFKEQSPRYSNSSDLFLGLNNCEVPTTWEPKCSLDYASVESRSKESPAHTECIFLKDIPNKQPLMLSDFIFGLSERGSTEIPEVICMKNCSNQELPVSNNSLFHFLLQTKELAENSDDSSATINYGESDSTTNRYQSTKKLSKRVERKMARCSGKEYEKNTGQVVRARLMGPNPCLQATRRCRSCKDFSDEQRKKIFDQYWGLCDPGKQRDWLRAHAHSEPVAVLTKNKETRRKNSLHYYLPDVQGLKQKVCFKFFCATLDLGEFAVRNTIKNYSVGTIPRKTRKKE